MIDKQELIDTIERNQGIIAKQAAGLSHQECLLQPPFRGNCMNWVLGHILDNRNTMLKTLGQTPAVAEAIGKRYGFGSEPVLADGEDVLPLERLLERLAQSAAQLKATLEAATAETLDAPITSFRGEETVGEHVRFLGWHDTYHTGQTELLRQLAGTDDKVI